MAAAGRNANFLLNTGPMPDGRIQPENVSTFKEIGGWLDAYGESIFKTRGGALDPRPWGVTTQSREAIYVHILNWRDKRISLPIGKIGVRAASFVENGKPVMFESTDDGIELNMEPEDLTEWVTVIPLDIESALN